MATFDAISNLGDQPLISVFKSYLGLSSVRAIRGAVSFLMTSGVMQLKADFKRLADAGVPITIVFGDDFHLTQSKALSMLMDIGCELRLYSSETHSSYHPKLWIIEQEDERAVIVGSSNLSHGGLRSNAEANVLISGTAEELEAFDKLWTGLASGSKEFTANDLNSYIDAELAASVPPPKGGATETSASINRIRQHIERWQRYIAEPHRSGQLEKWRGWYLVPEQGQLTDAKLIELQQILEALTELPEYLENGLVSFGTDNAGIANASAVLDAAGVTTSHSYSDPERRTWFVRQQRLYLRTFGWLEQVDGEHFRITAAGELFAAAVTAAERTQMFTEALYTKKWAFGQLAFYSFLVDLLKLAPDQRLYFDDMSLIVIHSYHRAELSGIANLVTAYRGLPESERRSVRSWADIRLRELLDMHGGGTAYGRYRHKVADLLVAFGNTSGLKYVPAEMEDLSYLRIV